MNIKLIVMDMDGTLLNSKGEISEKNLDALKKAQENGVHLMIASGRHPDGLDRFGKQLRMNEIGGYFVGINGGMVVKYPEYEKLFHKTIDTKNIQELFDFGIKHEMEVMAVHDHKIYDSIPKSLLEVKEKYRIEHQLSDEIKPVAGLNGMIQDHRKNYNEINIVERYLDEYGESNKVCFSHNQEVMENFIPQIHNAFGDRFNIMRTGHTWTELSLKGVDKGTGINLIKGILKIDDENIMAFGDGENDIPMFEACKYGIAMENAMPKLKEKAFAITKSNNDDGIAQALIDYKIICS